MCGIAGIYNLAGQGNIDQVVLKRMGDVLYHRGPDDSGFYADEYTGFAHKRLSIIDLTHAGHQPMSNEDQGIWITYNGEIYNFQELREELLRKGHIFKSHTDTEVIIHLYEEEGVRCVTKLRGMFAFAIWDRRAKRFFAARDRMGEKPFVYMILGNRFYFASEIKALLEVPGVSREIDLAGLHHYFFYPCIPPPYTIFKNINKLPPASYLLIENGRVNLKRYWHLDYGKKALRSFHDCCEEYSDILKDTVSRMLVSDVPLGVMLSGGVDSSSIVATMSSFHKKIKTFSIGFEKGGVKDPEFKRAQMVADMFNTEHHALVFSQSEIEILPKMIKAYDEPFRELTAPYVYYLCEFMSRNVKTVLSGYGADEVFGGYRDYNRLKLYDTAYGIGSIIPKPPFDAMKKIFPSNKSLSRFCRYIHASSLPLFERRAVGINNASRTLAESLYSQKFRKAIEDVETGRIVSDYFFESNADNYLEGTLYTDLMVYHMHGTVVITDTSGMAHSLEIRAPFLDKRMAEFSANIPARYKVPYLFNDRTNKFIMKKSMENALPKDLLYAHKLGLGANIKVREWMRFHWRKIIEEKLFDGHLSSTGLFSMDYIKEKWNDFIAGDNDILVIWAVFVLSVWLDMYEKNTAAGEIQDGFRQNMEAFK